MERLLKLKYMGNDLKILITDIDIPDSAYYEEIASVIWANTFGGNSSPNMAALCGYATVETMVAYTDYYDLIGALVGNVGENTNNLYLNASYNWDEEWPEPCGSGKVLIPPGYGNWICPANERYCVWGNAPSEGGQLTTATVYDKDDNQITATSGGSSTDFTIPMGMIVLSGVNDWEAFRSAQTFNDAMQVAGTVTVRNTGVNPYVESGTGITYSLLRLIWDFVKKLPGDEDDPTVDPEDESDDPYSDDDSPYDPSDTGGGDGDGDDPYDPGDDINEPGIPDISIADSGLITIYTPQTSQLAALASYLWSNDFITSMVKQLYADALDVIISLGFLPFNIPTAGVRNIKVGDRDTGISSNYPSVKYIKFDMGSVALKSTLGAYIDYAPYTKGDIYIPFVGYVPLDIDAFMEHTIGLKYICDLCTGSAIALLLRDGKTWQQFSCNLLTQIPLSAANYAQMYQTIISATAILAGAGVAGAAGIGGAAVGGEAAEGAQAIASQSGGAAKAASGIMSAAATKPQIQKSNNLSLSSGLLGNKKAFIQLYRPNLALPDNQNKFQGYPSYIETVLSACSGYTRVSSINLAVPGATGTELSMIDSILKTGFIIGSGSSLSGSGIVLGKNNSPVHQINKDVTSVTTLTGTFRDSVSVINPTVRIEYDNPTDFDYVYISAFKRKYFVENIVMVRKGVMDVSLRVDVLDSFAAGILGNKAIIDKSAQKYNLYLNDDSLKMYQRPLIQTYEFPNAFFDQHEFVLIVAGS